MKTGLGLLLAAICLFAASAEAQTLDVVHRFQSGGGAYGRLIQATDGDFYGTTSFGGTNGVGTIFRMDASGVLTTLHSFGYTDGANPYAALLQGADGNFYGTASAGGTSNVGTVFKMDPAGHVTALHSFSGPDGAGPWAPLIQAADGTFYGTTRNGGAGGFGTVFKVDSAGKLTSLHSFEDRDTGYPYAALIQAADGGFYGTTAGSGCPNYAYYATCGFGMVFKMNAAGYVNALVRFSLIQGGYTRGQGANPHGALVQDSDGNLYGTTISHRRRERFGWVTTYGTIFKLDTSGTFHRLHTFTAGEGTGSWGGLVLASDGNLYGTTTGGTAFRVSASGSFETLHSLTAPEGSVPYAGLFQAVNGNFYGPTLFGGAGEVGTIFKLDSSNSVTPLYSFSSEGFAPQASLIQAPGGIFYGTTQNGGAGGLGTVFKTNSTGSITTLHSFDGASGTQPHGALIRAADGNFYGTTSSGGAGGVGTVFKMDSAGNFTTLHSFNGGDGSVPLATLIQLSDGNFYGTTRDGGVSGFGTVFRMDSTGSMTTLHSFDNTDGSHPCVALIRGADGSLYGTTAGDLTKTWGTVFKITASGAFTPLHSFNQTDGASPSAALIQVADGTFYGTTSGGGTEGHGTVFKMDSTGNVTTLHSFNGVDGALPSAALIQLADGNLYGTTAAGGGSQYGGTIFKMDVSGNLTTLQSFKYPAGLNLYAGLVLGADGALWGAASAGGDTGRGTIFRFILGAASFDVTGISPTSGPHAGGTPVSITGTGFQAGARVMMGDSPANAVSVGGTSSVSALAPALSPGTLNAVTVTNPNASFGTGSSLFFADFLDVEQNDGFHDDVETIFRKGITAGYGNGAYGRDDPATRAQMAVFLLKAKHGSSYVPPSCAGVFSDVACPGMFTDWIEQLRAEGITTGCGGGLYCPDSNVTRRQMAVLLLKSKEGSGYTPPAAKGIFGDVPTADPFAPWIEELYNRKITAGCQASPLLYCPDSPSTRGQMAVFLVETFGLVP